MDWASITRATNRFTLGISRREWRKDQAPSSSPMALTTTAPSTTTLPREKATTTQTFSNTKAILRAAAFMDLAVSVAPRTSLRGSIITDRRPTVSWHGLKTRRSINIQGLSITISSAGRGR